MASEKPDPDGNGLIMSFIEKIFIPPVSIILKAAKSTLFYKKTNTFFYFCN